jgi:CHAT domain-containing protein/Tfp pilus assembly protein PilF
MVFKLVLTGASVLVAGFGHSLSRAEPHPWTERPKAQDTQQSTTGQPDVRQLIPGAPIERELAGGQAHWYQITLAAGQYLRVIVDQRGIDVVLRLLDADGKELAKADREYEYGLEPITFLAESPGVHRLEVGAAEKEAVAGRYEIRLDALHDPTPEDLRRLDAARLITEGDQLRRQGTAESLRKAVETYEAALPLWRAVGDQPWEADTLQYAGLVYLRLGDRQKALHYFTQALALYQAVGYRVGEAYTLHNVAYAYLLTGELQKALDYYSQALSGKQALGDRRGVAITLSDIGSVYNDMGEFQKALDPFTQALQIGRAIGDRRLEGTALNNVATVYTVLGEPQQALDRYIQALALARALGNRRVEAARLNNIGTTYLWLGEPQTALDYYTQALPITRAVGDRAGEAITLGSIGSAYSALGEPQKALDFHQQSLTLRQAVGDRRGEAVALSNMGLVYHDLEELQQALAHYQQALAIFRAIGDRYSEASTLHRLGRVSFSRGEKQQALDSYGPALALRRIIGDRQGEVQTLCGMARVEADHGSLTEARAHTEAALAIIESLRTKAPSQDLRASFLASHQSAYELFIDLLMRQHHTQPSSGHDAVALQASERARARSLLEILTEARADIRQGVDPILLERERSLQQRINVKSDRLTRLLSGKHTEDQAAAARKELDALLIEFQQVQGQIRARSPRYAALTQPQPLSLKDIQQQVLDDDTLLLEYALGEERSYLWAVTPTSIKSFDLPKREDIEPAARRVYDLLKVSHRRDARRQAERAAAELSQMVLGPVAQQLGHKRLLIVSDGALQYVPFAALPRPGIRDQGSGISRKETDREQPLIVDHEIVNLPSASVLAVLRRETAGRKPADKIVALLADPVFDGRDVRVKTPMAQNVKPTTNDQRLTTSDQLVRSARDAGVMTFERLVFTRREAEAIAALVPVEKKLKAVDFEANRANALSAEVGQYRIVHFATHGLLNSQHPELSGIVLSLVDQQGQPQDGFVRLHEIYNLALNADLVVLSACQTALGKEIKGEGLIGLTRGFMYAGAPRVVASVWDVRDHTTAELMKRFYRGMLKEGLRPAAALRAAQISLWKEKRWEAPYYWAGFVLQGEWR